MMREQMSKWLFRLRTKLILLLAGKLPVIMNVNIYNGENLAGICIEPGVRRYIVTGCHIFYETDRASVLIAEKKSHV